MQPATGTEVARRVCELAAVQAGVDTSEVALETRLEDDLGYDSLDKIEFAMSIEEAFGIEIPDDETEQVRTVADAAAAVERFRACRG